MHGYMPRGPNVAISLCIVCNAKQDLSHCCMCTIDKYVEIDAATINGPGYQVSQFCKQGHDDIDVLGSSSAMILHWLPRAAKPDIREKMLRDENRAFMGLPQI